MQLPEYAELKCVSNFSFLRGASQPEELVERAKQLGYAALAITDECSLAGVVRAHVAAREHGLRLLIGSQFLVEPEPVDPNAIPFTLTVLACHLEGYGNLSQFITKLRRASEKAPIGCPSPRSRARNSKTAWCWLRPGAWQRRRSCSGSEAGCCASSWALLAGGGKAAAARRRDVAVPAEPGGQGHGDSSSRRAMSTSMCDRASPCRT